MSTPAPQGFPQIGLSGPMPGALADLQSLANDVEFARQCALGYLAYSSSTPTSEQPLVAKALWFAGAIAYRRAFTSGRGHLVAGGSRLKIKDAWTTLLTTDQLAAHDDTLRMANQHIAHRVADHEGAVVVAVLTPPPGPREVAGVGHMLVHMIGPEVVVAERLASVCDVLLGLFRTEAERLGTLIRTKLDEANIDELYAVSSIPGKEFTVPGEDSDESGEPDGDATG
ncbi:hypothetical protein MycrhN_3229 [Mycolicibacterium rhodesiae NBB3]|uniref:Uncharacterized protein n=1 Tax=Mycolicibacterium rhodesiae (strain NBB3) TaxID=710685 RepID=G8RNQ8_MYCRN|nr:hypothetical protein [Mycolicibacterium rhodesiae]AEV73759.1 hypothetical protein MycrhN_3229 [Mycolicibacterium rhodesiae NBB3]